jgi:hypothetical protein
MATISRYLAILVTVVISLFSSSTATSWIAQKTAQPGTWSKLGVGAFFVLCGYTLRFIDPGGASRNR